MWNRLGPTFLPDHHLLPLPSTTVSLNTTTRSTSWFPCWSISYTYSAYTVCCTTPVTGCTPISKHSYRILRCVFYLNVPQSACLNRCFSAGLSAIFQSLLVRAQSSHHYFGSGHVSASQAPGDRRFIHPRNYYCQSSPTL